ncbi:hypothetical protein B0H17DRAFT_1212783 [Mycena rosella]|uniref:Uncharacterized protein n=1 Tax=Mycena rosella TaxID=1033263 RepID=A0AAD7CUF1_MYCRO|nr:hypothetical protein B0H17DRAFT_1212783 [Mycena rosella]
MSIVIGNGALATLCLSSTEIEAGTQKICFSFQPLQKLLKSQIPRTIHSCGLSARDAPLIRGWSVAQSFSHTVQCACATRGGGAKRVPQGEHWGRKRRGDRPPADERPVSGGQSADEEWTVGGSSADGQRTVGGLSADEQRTVRGSSAD